MKPTGHTFIYRVATALFLTAALAWALPAPVAEPQASAAVNAAVAKGINTEWGIQVVAVHTAAAGNMVDLRYAVVDADKASALFSKKTRPYLVHQKTGKVLAVPRTAKVGPLMSSYRPQKGRIYWMFFGNQSKLVRTGDKVTVVIGDFKAEDLTVR